MKNEPEFTVRPIDCTQEAAQPVMQKVMDSLALQFAEREAFFLNEYLPRFLPQWLIDAANDRRASWKTKLAVDVMAIWLAVKKVHVERNTHYGMKTGKGFRAGVSFDTVDAVTSKIYQGKTLIAEKRFEMNVVINKK